MPKTRRKLARPARRQPWWRRPSSLFLGAAVAGVLAAVVAGLAFVLLDDSDSDSPAAEVENFGLAHVHGLATDPEDGSLYAGTHFGLYRIAADGEVALVSERLHDFMGFTIVAPDRFVASGHPDLEERDELAPLLGIIESTDKGLTWESRSLLGEADFHSLEFARASVYGYNSSAGAFMVSEDDGGTWQARSPLEMYDFAVKPSGAEVILAATQAGIRRSEDGGRTWSDASQEQLVFLDWGEGDQVWGIGPTGELMRSDDAGGSWQPAGNLGAPPAALHVNGTDIYAADQTAGVRRSSDGGATWTVLYQGES